MESTQGIATVEHSTMENYSCDAARDAPENGTFYPRICRFYSQGRYCQFGRRCRFLHQRPGPIMPPRTDSQKHAVKTEGTNTVSEQICLQEASGQPESTDTKNTERPPNTVAQNPSSCGIPSSDVPTPSRPGRRDRYKNPCRYFLSGYCAMAERCRFWHPEDLLPLIDKSDDVKGDDCRRPQPQIPRTPVARPSVLKEEVRLAEMTPDVARLLRQTEVSQLMKRFPKEKLIIQEREDGKLTYYRVTVEATDPDWPFDLKEMDIMVSFPDDYPLEVFTLDIPEDQDLPPIMGRNICKASEEWLQAKHATNKLMGKVELLFRPYLCWLDRNMERLFTEGARMLKRNIDAERAGIEFVPYQQLQAAVSAASADHDQSSSQTSGPHFESNLNRTHASSVDREDVFEGSGQQESIGEVNELSPDKYSDSDSYTSCDDDEEELNTSTVSADDGLCAKPGGSAEPRRGTEVTLIGLQLGEGTATLVAEKVTVSLQCSRCKIAADLTMARKHTYSAQCEKCNAHISATFCPSLLHQYSAVLGYLDLKGVAPVDLVLKDSQFVVGCLSCSSEGPLQGLLYGLPKELNCLQCYGKLSVLVEATRFENIQVSSGTGQGDKGSSHQRQKKLPRDPAIQPGKPLPDQGTCKHFRKSCRWLRFPCCGKAYPCDMCHDEEQDHLMELATRMICGYCAKEQPYSNGKPCTGCGTLLTKGSGTSHWEGGQGCRNKTKMCRKDKQKYGNSAKTVSRRSHILHK